MYNVNLPNVHPNNEHKLTFYFNYITKALAKLDVIDLVWFEHDTHRASRLVRTFSLLRDGSSHSICLPNIALKIHTVYRSGLCHCYK